MSYRARYLSTAAAFLLLLLRAGSAEAATYYVATTGNDSSDGTSPATAWATVTYAATIAAAGDTVFIKAGHYVDEKVVIKNSGTEQAPVIFQGYWQTPGDTPDPQYCPGGGLNPALLPVLEAKDPALQVYPGTAIGLWDKSYVEIRNLGVTRYQHGIFPQRSNHILIENIWAVDFGVTSNQGAGIWVYDCSEITIRSCVVEDASMTNYDLMMMRNSLVESCKSYAVTSEEGAVTDYHIVIVDGQNNVIRGCQAENLHPEATGAHPGHGIGIKDFAEHDGYHNPHSEGNQIIDCFAHNTYENYFVAHEAHHNEFIGCTAVCDHNLQGESFAAIIIRDGAHDNTFRDFRGEGARSAVEFQETVEGPDGAVQVVSNNTIVNSIFVDSIKGIELWNADNNTLDNCVFDNIGSWMFVRFPFERVGHGNSIRNSIVTNMTGDLFLWDKGSTEEFAFTHTDFWQNKFAMPPGEGNLDKDPLFANPGQRDYHLKSQAGRWDAITATWVKDTETSPCIDMGDPSGGYASEPCPNGGRLDMGAYGNTVQASISASGQPCDGGVDGHAGPASAGSPSGSSGSSDSGGTAVCSPLASEASAADSGGCSCGTRPGRSNFGWFVLAAWAVAAAALRRLPPHRGHCVGRHQRVAGDDREPLHNRLRHEDPIEWVPVQRGKCAHQLGVRNADG